MTGYGRAYLALCLSLLVFLQGSAGEARLAKPGSTHPSFPLDAFAKPAYKVIFQDDQPIGNQTARDILRASKRQNDQEYGLQNVNDPNTSGDQGDANDKQQRPFKAFLHRTSPDTLHVCTLAHQQQAHAKRLLDQDEEAMNRYRAGVLRRALALLSPLKTGCLFHTHDWFTYSFCHGDALRQFRALPSTLGGGKTPAMDPTQDSYVLGRWKADSETIRPNSDPQHTLETSTADEDGEDGAGESENEDGLSVRMADEEEQAGTHLMELVHFSSIESSPTSATSTGATVEGKGRYISQYWSDGTLCNINNEPRTTEVQFHCAKSPPVDRIALIKEVTTCNYVVVIETPRLCEEPALAQVDEEVDEVHCRPVLSDEALQERYQQNVRDTHASLIEGARQAEEEKEESVAEGEQSVPSPTNLEGEAETDSIEGQIGILFEKLTKTKLKQGKPPSDEVEVVVGMDEEGNFIIEPRGDRARNPKAEQVESAEPDVFYDAQDSNGDPSTTKTMLSAEKIAELVQRLKESGLLGSGDAATLKIVQGYDADGDGGTADQGITPPSQQTQQDGTRQAQPVQRGNMMVRETETFPERVDRIFRAREEAAQRRAENAQEQRDGDERSGGEAERARQQRHVEL